jgi:hypothetical protein
MGSELTKRGPAIKNIHDASVTLATDDSSIFMAIKTRMDLTMLEPSVYRRQHG